MSQTYPLPMPPVLKIDAGVARTNPAATYPTLATSTDVYHPNIWSEKLTNHPASAPDYVQSTLIGVSSNMPY